MSSPSPRGDGDSLTVRQERVLRAIRDSIDTRGYPPSMQEIGTAVGLPSTSSVAHHLDVLCRKGLLRTAPNQARTYMPTDLVSKRDTVTPEAGVAHVPLVGVSSSGPAGTGQQAEEVLAFPRQLVGDGKLFAVAVTGGLEDAGILDGDLVVVRRQTAVENSDLVGVVLDGEIAVRRFKQDGANTWLLANNGTAPIWANSAALLGRVVAVMRSL